MFVKHGLKLEALPDMDCRLYVSGSRPLLLPKCAWKPDGLIARRNEDGLDVYPLTSVEMLQSLHLNVAS